MQYKCIVILAQVLSLQTIALLHSSLFEVEHESKKRIRGGLKETSDHWFEKRILFRDILFFF